jgi:poly(3-hydroxybutyrate) depolymerase
LDVPAHGEDHRPDEASELNGWRERVDHGEKLVLPFAENASKVLDRLIQEGIADPARVGAYGTSRGGFMAFHFAALDRRVKVVAGISPVTDLSALREFHGSAHPESVEKLSLIHLVPSLAGRPVWISIGNHDERVQTDAAIAFTRALVNYNAQGKQDDAVIPVDLLVGPTPGHTKIDRASELLADWILRQFR